MGPERIDRAACLVAATRPETWRTLVDPARLVRWLPPEGMCGSVDVWEPWPGGRFRLTLAYTNPGHATAGKTSAGEDVVEGRFVEMVENERMVWAVVFRSDDPAFAGEMRMTWRLRDAPRGTEVSIAAEDVPRGIGAEDHAAGLASTLANLASELA